MITPYKCQIDAVNTATREGKGIIVMPTGTGKSITMALLIHSLQVKTLVVVPSVNLKTQLMTCFTQLFGSLKNITVENIDSKALKTQGDYDCLIIDEAHHVAAATYKKLNMKAWNNIYYRFFFTATPFRSRDEENIVFESIAGKVIYRLPYKESVQEGLIVPLEAYYIDLPVSKTKASTWAGVYKELVVDNKYRNQVTLDLLGRLHANNCATLCLVKEIKHGENLSQGLIAFANGQDGFSNTLIQGFNQARLTTLIGTTGVLGEGVDTKPAEYIIIAGLGKSKNAFMQQVGRGFRRYGEKTSCKIILFRDASHKWTLNHFRAQCKVLRDEYGVKPVKLEI